MKSLWSVLFASFATFALFGCDSDECETNDDCDDGYECVTTTDEEGEEVKECVAIDADGGNEGGSGGSAGAAGGEGGSGGSAGAAGSAGAGGGAASGDFCYSDDEDTGVCITSTKCGQYKNVSGVSGICESADEVCCLPTTPGASFPCKTVSGFCYDKGTLGEDVCIAVGGSVQSGQCPGDKEFLCCAGGDWSQF